MAKPTPTLDRVNELLKLDPETGTLTWRIRHGSKKAAGERAGWLNPQSGYRNICIDGYDYREHVVVWFMLKGEWAPRKIDHHDLNRANNAPSNLRRANESQQRSNAKLRADNTTGERGVCRHRDGGYDARVQSEGYHFRKYFQGFEKAAAAVRAERAKVFGEFAPSYDQHQGA